MVTCEQNDWIYTPDTPPLDEWRPTVSSVVYNAADDTYTLTGTQISGLINGADEGDDMTMAENYPIVSLTNEAGDVYYCRSFNFSNMMPSKGSAPETCQFTTPADLPDGTYSLFVSAVGVRSKEAYSFKVGVGGDTVGTGGAGGSAGAAGAAGASGASFGGAGPGGVTSVGGTSGSGASPSSTGGAGGSGMIGGTSAGGGLTGTGAMAGTGFPGAIGGGANADGTASSGDSAGCGCHAAAAPANRGIALGVFGLALLAFRRRRLHSPRV
jgi:MYXO-CTERM domain-containing protein